MALDSLKEGLRNPSMAFVYHCLNHYFCPVGYEEIPKNATDAYKWVYVPRPSHPSVFRLQY